MGSLRSGRLLGIATLAVLSLASYADAQPNCNTALSRIARAAADQAVVENQDKACAGFKKDQFAIDKTKSLKLESFKVCEAGPVVTAEVSVHIECATSDAAFIKTQVADTLFATVTANLDNCVVSNVRVWANGFLTTVGLSFTNASQKLNDAAVKEIKPYCSKK